MSKDKIAVFLGGTGAYNRNRKLYWAQHRRRRETSREADTYNKISREASIVVGHIRRVFSRTLGPYHLFSVDHVGSGWSFTEGKVYFFLHYCIFYKELRVERSVIIRCVEDVKAEAWRIWGLMDSWSPFEAALEGRET